MNTAGAETHASRDSGSACESPVWRMAPPHPPALALRGAHGRSARSHGWQQHAGCRELPLLRAGILEWRARHGSAAARLLPGSVIRAGGGAVPHPPRGIWPAGAAGIPAPAGAAAGMVRHWLFHRDGAGGGRAGAAARPLWAAVGRVSLADLYHARRPCSRCRAISIRCPPPAWSSR